MFGASQTSKSKINSVGTLTLPVSNHFGRPKMRDGVCHKLLIELKKTGLSQMHCYAELNKQKYPATPKDKDQSQRAHIRVSQGVDKQDQRYTALDQVNTAATF